MTSADHVVAHAPNHRRRFIGIGQILGAFATVAIVVALGWQVRSSLSPAGSTDRDKEIDTQFDTLGFRPTQIDFTVDKPIAVRRAIMSGDFATAERITTEVLAASHIQGWRFYPFEDFVSTLFFDAPPALAKHLDDWVSSDRTSSAALLYRAQSHFDAAWAARGQGFASEVSADGAESFGTELNAALGDVNAAIALNPNNPYDALLRLRVLSSDGLSQRLGAAFADSISKFPAYYPLYEVMLNTLQPRWGGSVSAMKEFVDAYAGKASPDSPLKLLYLSLYRHLLSTASLSCTGPQADARGASDCVSTFMGDAAPSPVVQQVEAALSLYDHTDRFEFGLAVRDIIDDTVGLAGADLYATALLQLAAKHMHSHIELVETQSGQNDYIVDELAAGSWASQDMYANEVAKSFEALADTRNTVFPSEEEKNVALARIYRHLAYSAERQRQYADL